MKISAPLVFLFGICVLPQQSLAQTYPAKPIRLVVPYVPGGAPDIVSRILAPHMIEGLGQQIIIENRGGGATMLGTNAVAKAPADGYTLLMANIALGANPALFKSMPYDTAKEFAPISLVTTVPTLLVVHPSVPVRSVKELIAYAKARPGMLNYASAGNGSANHLTMEVFANMAGINVVHVPYKGGAPAIADTVGGQVTMMFASAPASLQYVKAGRLVALGISTKDRHPTLSGLPTVAEAGVPGFEVKEWMMLLAPAGTPAPIVDRLYREAAKSLGFADVRERIAALSSTPVGSTPAEAAAFLKAELQRWSDVVRSAGIKAQD
jgi:tripartite-type tricarboxylate transporter receptor subunit TctC